MYLGAKIGFLGANGAGKSTLMKILAGVDSTFEGDYFIDPNIKIGHLPQVRWTPCFSMDMDARVYSLFVWNSQVVNQPPYLTHLLFALACASPPLLL